MAYLWATVLLIGCIAAWISTLFLLPGNWAMVVMAALYAWLLPAEYLPRLSWVIVGVSLGLALLGEVLEFAAGAAGAAKHGGSRRGMVLSIVGTIAGSILGAAVGVPIPVVGSVIGALLFGAVGAFLGAYLGEYWVGRAHEDRVQISTAATIGRLIGTTGKMLCGAAMVVLIGADAFFDLGSSAAPSGTNTRNAFSSTAVNRAV